MSPAHNTPRGSKSRHRPTTARTMTLDSMLTRSLVAVAIGAALICLGLILDPVLALLERLRP